MSTLETSWSALTSLGSNATEAYKTCIEAARKGLSAFPKFVTKSGFTLFIEYNQPTGSTPDVHYTIDAKGLDVPEEDRKGTLAASGSKRIAFTRPHGEARLTVNTTEGFSDDFLILPYSEPVMPRINVCGSPDPYVCRSTGSMELRQGPIYRLEAAAPSAWIKITGLVGRNGAGCRFVLGPGISILDPSNVNNGEIQLNVRERISVYVRDMTGNAVGGFFGTYGAPNGACLIFTSDNFELVD